MCAQVLEMAQSHHKARRLLNQVSMKMNMQLKGERMLGIVGVACGGINRVKA